MNSIEELQNVPSNWVMKPFKYVVTFGRGLSITKENLTESGIACLSYGDIHSKYPFEVKPKSDSLPFVPTTYLDTDKKCLVSPGDIVFADTSEDIEGSGNFTQIGDGEDIFAGYHTVIARPASGLNSRFLAYVLESEEFRNQIRSKVKGVKVYSITRGILGNSKVWFPDNELQSAIASYLDSETRRIDSLIGEKRNFINLLKEKRQALISHVVTKGLDPDVELKDSGVEWIGITPSHWNVIKLKWIANTESGGTPTSSNYTQYYENGTIPWIRTTDLNNSSLYETPVKITDDALRDTACSIIPNGSVLVAMYGGAGSIGKHSLLCFDSAINQAVCAIIPSPKLNPRFLHRFVEFYRPFWMVEADGTRKDPNINQDIVKNLWIPLPPVDEQERISDFIDRRTNRIESLIEETKRSIDLLKEHRTALISAAVTGKIDLRDKEVA